MNVVQLDVMWIQVLCHCSLVLLYKIPTDVASYMSTSSILLALKNHIKIPFASSASILIWIKRAWHWLCIEFLYKILAYKMNTESDPGIQMIWVDREFVLHAFFLKKEGRDAGNKIISI